jgi:hypothetical protein
MALSGRKGTLPALVRWCLRSEATHATSGIVTVSCLEHGIYIATHFFSFIISSTMVCDRSLSKLRHGQIILIPNSKGLVPHLRHRKFCTVRNSFWHGNGMYDNVCCSIYAHALRGSLGVEYNTSRGYGGCCCCCCCCSWEW